MASYSNNQTPEQHWRSISDAIEAGSLKQVARIINKSLSTSDVAHLIESSPPKQRNIIWQLVDDDYRGEVLQDLSEDVQAYFLSKLNAQELIDATEDLDTDDLADILQNLPEAVIGEVLDSMDSQDRERVEEVLAYEEDTAGGLMNTDTVTIRADITMDVVLRYLRRHRSLPEMTDSLLVVSRNGVLVGILPLTTMLVSSPSATVREVMETDITTINVNMPDSEVANVFERQDLVTEPVVN
ncbi:magnesium transporter, partial [Oleiphilus sp. HI0067]|uniref:magnesium transporter n=1 Tax=Oleiphilus sp. HI0067 TaxID=1822243 RepID=UPI000ABEE015